MLALSGGIPDTSSRINLAPSCEYSRAPQRFPSFIHRLLRATPKFALMGLSPLPRVHCSDRVQSIHFTEDEAITVVDVFIERAHP
jgi:hypothetical protein